MIRARSSAKHYLPIGRWLAAAALVCTLTASALVAWDAGAEGSLPNKVSAKSAEGAAGVRSAINTPSARPALEQSQVHNAGLPCGVRTAAPRRSSAAKHWERRGLLLLRWCRALFG